MLIWHSSRRPYPLGRVWLLISLLGQQLSAPITLGAQSDSSGSGQRPAAQSSAPAATATQAGRDLFNVHCVKCHGADGSGRAARGPLPNITDFTDSSWQARRSDAQLLASIIDGKGQDMPSFREKISQDQARGLVAHVRSFVPTTDKSGPKEGQGTNSPSGFEAEARRLQKEMEELKKQLRQLSEESATRERSKQAESPPSPPPKQSEPSPPSDPVKPSIPEAAGEPVDQVLFREHCVKCHAEDGTGSKVRHRKPEIPNFTDASWQLRRSDAQLLASILDGKGSEMLPFREKLNEGQARSLVTYIRRFAPTTGKSVQDQQEWVPLAFPTSGKSAQNKDDATASAETGELQLPRCFVDKLVTWLGKFHPPVVHFPIALLTAAAVAELLRVATGKPSCGAVSRYCVWFGALAAVPAGLLGWCCGRFHLSDASGVMMAHRWLGTSTMAGATLVLVLSEMSRRPDRRRTRAWFRFALVVVAVVVLVTGFFGGAVVFGLDHYAWPG
jgi:mono/diheme cytochrome c family protein/uncharacterized membrane protein